MVSLHALEAAHAVVQHLGGRVHGDALREGADLGASPASALLVLHYEQVVREGAPEDQVLYAQVCRAVSRVLLCRVCRPG